MRRVRWTTVALFCFALVGGTACDSSDDGGGPGEGDGQGAGDTTPGGDETGGDVAATPDTGGGTGDVAELPVEFTQTALVSGCGGFAAPAGDKAEGDDYCAAETLDWTYDAASQTLVLTNARVSLNCCGAHDMTAEWQAGVYVVTETDQPDGEQGRCRCMCVFDYSITLVGVPAGVMSLLVKRAVYEEEGGPYDVWQGDVDLGSGSGSIVIDGDAIDWCHVTGV